jgi:hypothetical protein
LLVALERFGETRELLKGVAAVVEGLGMVRAENERPIVVIESLIIPPEFRLRYSQEIKRLNQVPSERKDGSTQALGFGIVSAVVGVERRSLELLAD